MPFIIVVYCGMEGAIQIEIKDKKNAAVKLLSHQVLTTLIDQ